MTMLADAAGVAARTLFTAPAASARRLAAEDELIRTPLPLNRRISFVQSTSNSGCSSVVTQLAGIFARRRSGAVLGVVAAAGATNMIDAAGLDASSPDRANPSRLQATSSSDAVTGLRRTSSGLYVLDPRNGQGVNASAAEWEQQLMPISRFFDLTLTDWGVRTPATDLGAVAANSHVVCIVAPADRYPAEVAASLAPAVHAQPGSPAVLLVLVDVSGKAGRAPHSMLRDDSLPIAVIPHDPRLAGPAGRGTRPPSARSRRAHSTLAAALIERALAAPQRKAAS